VDKQLWHVVAGSKEMMGGGRLFDSWLSFYFGQLLSEEIPPSDIQSVSSRFGLSFTHEVVLISCWFLSSFLFSPILA
jgi:hypothetical protein